MRGNPFQEIGGRAQFYRLRRAEKGLTRQAVVDLYRPLANLYVNLHPLGYEKAFSVVAARRCGALFRVKENACEKNHTNMAHFLKSFFIYLVFIKGFFSMNSLWFSLVGSRMAQGGIVFARAFPNVGRLFSGCVSSRICGDINYFDHIRWYTGHFEVP